ncbi:MAG: Gfo/Idh/MocA family protein [Candidatus Avispirillum sp.]
MVKIGLVGVRAFSIVDAVKKMPGEAVITAMCDLREEALAAAREKIGLTESQCYRVYEDMLERADIDAVIISSPMNCHVPQAIQALQAGKHVMCEVTAAVTMDELWWLIEEVEKSGKIYMYAENYCYTPEVQLVRSMVKAGMFGEIYYGEGEYTHQCSDLCFHEGKPTWRHYWQMGTRGAFYPTHSLGPVMQCFDDDRIVSVATFTPGCHNSLGLRADDLTQTMCQLESGKLVKIRVDTVSPRPHNMMYYSIQGTKGCYEAARGLGDSAKVALVTEGEPDAHLKWKPLSDFNGLLPERYKGNAGEGAGHGGGDYYIVSDFIDAVKTGKQPELNVYKAAEWTSVALLSQLSVTNGGRVMEVPHFRPNMDYAEKKIKL